MILRLPLFDIMALCKSTFPETAHFAKTLWLLGCVLESIAYGVLLALAHSCFQALRKRTHGSPYINTGLIIYVLLVVVTTTAVEATAIKSTLYGVLDNTCVGAYLHVSHPYFGPPDVISFLITLLTDGLLVSTFCPLEGVADTHRFRFGDAMLLPQASRGLDCYGSHLYLFTS